MFKKPGKGGGQRSRPSSKIKVSGTKIGRKTVNSVTLGFMTMKTLTLKRQNVGGAVVSNPKKKKAIVPSRRPAPVEDDEDPEP